MFIACTVLFGFCCFMLGSCTTSSLIGWKDSSAGERTFSIVLVLFALAAAIYNAVELYSCR